MMRMNNQKTKRIIVSVIAAILVLAMVVPTILSVIM